MTRKAKTCLALVLLVLGIAVTSFVLTGNQDHVRVSYAGVSETDSRRVLFNITNATDRSLYCAAYAALITNGIRRLNQKQEGEFYGRLAPNSGVKFDMQVYSPAPWSVVVFHERYSQTNFATASRREFARWAMSRNLPRLSRFVWREPSAFQMVNGPAMRGNQLMAEKRR